MDSLKVVPNRSPVRPKVFIGSSAEGLTVARAIQSNLDWCAACTVWNQGVFGLGMTNIENLIQATRQNDFAVLVATADDFSSRRGHLGYSPRDNVIWELGLFMGVLGRKRTFVAYDRDTKPMLPSDLDGLCLATYSMKGHTSPRAALGAACTEIEDAIRVEMATVK